MHRLILLAFVALAGPALAQLPQPALNGNLIQVRPAGAPIGAPARTLAARAADVIQAADNGVVCDGVRDIGPPLQALHDRLTHALAPATTVQLPPGVCLWNTAVTFNQALRLRGHGAPRVGARAHGTTLRTTNTAITPLTFRGALIGSGTSIGFSTDGAEVSDVALEQAQTAPGPGWTPRAYPPFFANVSAPGVHYRNIAGYGIYAGISNTGNSGRFEAHGLRGQFFAYAVLDQSSMDNVRLSDFHIWPYWSSHPDVIAWQQANTDAIRMGRTDGPFLDRIFVFAARSALRLEQSAEGTPNKVLIGSLGADSVRTAIWVSSGTNITAQVGNLWHQGAQGVGTPAPVAGSSAIQVDQTAGIVLQIANLQSELDDLHTIALNSTVNRSIIRIGSAYVRSIAGGGTSSLIYAAGTGNNLPHDVSIATAAIVAPTAYLPAANFATTNAIIAVPGADMQMVYGVPTSGGRYAITNAQPKLVLASANQNPVPSLVIGLPQNPFEGLEASAMVTVPVNAVTFEAADDVVGAPGALAAFQAVRFKYYYTPTGYAWMRQ